MPLIKCPECGHDVSDTAASCPSCGYGIKKAKPVRVYYQKTRGRWGFPLAAAILATLYFGMLAAFYYGNGLDSSAWKDNMLLSIVSNGIDISMRMLMIGVAVNWTGILVNKYKLVRVAAIFYSVAAVFNLLHILFFVMPIVFGFVGVRKMRMLEESEEFDESL